MTKLDKKNRNLMHLVKMLHRLVENIDLEKHREAQDRFGALMGKQKGTEIHSIHIGEMYGEWIIPTETHLKKPIILYCHGGGYRTGSSLYARSLTIKLALASSMQILAFNYRLAPENPFPSALADAKKAWDYLLAMGYREDDIFVAGDSAGGNLALALVHLLKLKNETLPKGLVLLSPWTDLTQTGASYQTKAEIDPVLGEDYLSLAIRSYAQEEDLSNPLISPLYGDMEGLPPTYMQVGENEILLDDSVLLHQKMTECGVTAEIDIFKGMWHVFQMSPFKTANEAIEKCAVFLHRML